MRSAEIIFFEYRLGFLRRHEADVVHAKKVTPAAVRVVDVPGTGAALLGNLRQDDALLAVLDGWSGTLEYPMTFWRLSLSQFKLHRR